MHRADDRGSVRRVAIGVGEIGRARGEVHGFQKIAFTKPNARGDQSAVRHRVVRRRIFDVPAVFDGPTDFLKTFPRVGHRDDEIEALAIRRIGMKHFRRLAHDLLRVRLDEREADHARDEHRAVGAFGVAVDVAEVARHALKASKPNRGRTANLSATEDGDADSGETEPDPPDQGAAA